MKRIERRRNRQKEQRNEDSDAVLAHWCRGTSKADASKAGSPCRDIDYILLKINYFNLFCNSV